MANEYDKTGNLTAQNVGEGQSIQNSYNEIGQVTTVKNSEGTITYQYNQQGYLVSVTNVNGDVVSYAYDEYGNKTSMTYPDGRAVRYTYDSMNRMTSVTGLDGEVTTYAYDAAGRRVETASRTLTTEYTYDAVGNLSRQETIGSSNVHFQYTYNLNGYITGEVRTENGAAVESLYTYDPLGELTGFTQSTGYGEQYVYDKAGNMTAKTITGTDGQSVALKMTYNKGNQLVTMTDGTDKLTYGYDKNGSMVQKVLSSKQYGKLTDTYAYNSLDQLVSYTGYDGYQQRFAYDANGMRLSKSEYGNSNRSTLEELLRGDIAGLPEIVTPEVAATSTDETAIPAEYEWATTEYLYDITQEYYQVIEETTTKDNTTTTTAYAYGVERIAAYDTNATTQYIYDGRGSVVQTISTPAAGTSVSAALPQVEVQSYSYTAFGEQMGSKTSGFAYNAEDYDAGTGMINLRMRQYEPVLCRFQTYDSLHGQKSEILSINRYVYCLNNPRNYIDAYGMAGKQYKDPYNYLLEIVGNISRETIAEKIQQLSDGQIKEIWKAYYDKRDTLTEEEQEIISEGARKINAAKNPAEKRAIKRQYCTLLAQTRMNILERQEEKSGEVNLAILGFTKNNSSENKITNLQMVTEAKKMYDSDEYWYYYGGTGKTTVAKLHEVKERDINEKKLTKVGDKIAIDCIGYVVAIYRKYGLRYASKQGFTALSNTRNAFSNASIVNGNIYEIGEENLVDGMLVYKYTYRDGKWIIGHVGIYEAGYVYEARGFNDGLVCSPISEWDAFSWPDGMIVDPDAEYVFWQVKEDPDDDYIPISWEGWRSK